MTDTAIEIRVNGEAHRTSAGQTLLGLLSELNLDPQRIAVELNREIARRGSWQEKVLEHGDSLEIVEFVGGGLA